MNGYLGFGRQPKKVYPRSFFPYKGLRVLSGEVGKEELPALSLKYSGTVTLRFGIYFI